MAASVQSMSEYWKKIDLQELQKELDSTATELANRQDESDATRKLLVEQSREFKKNTPEDIRKVVSPLLKSFQSEIDALSKRSKAAEAAFLSVYKQIIDLPDPVPVLEHALQIQKKAQRVQDLEIENKQLRETLDEYNHEFAEVKNQEVTIKQLRDRLKEGEDRIEAVAETRTKEKERELQRHFAEKERQLQETQLSVAKQLGEAEQRVATLTKNLENVQCELFEVKTKYDEAISAKSDETEMVMADLERANERSTAAERDTEKLRQQLSALTSSLGPGRAGQQAGDMDQAIDMLQRTSLEVELAAKEKEIAQLVEDVQRLQASLHKLRQNTAHQVGRLEEELSSKSKAFKILEEKLTSQDDYEEIKRELCVLKSIEFSSTSPADEVDGDRPKSLEMLLLEKNKAIQSANTQLKVNNNDLSDTSSPALSTNAEAFVSVLGQEIAASYLNNNNNNNNYNSFSGKKLSSSPPKTGQSPPAYSAISPKQDTNKTHSPESADIPPQVPSSPHSDLSRHGRPPSRDVLHLPPPPSPQFFPPGYSHMMANFMGMNAANVKSEINGVQGLDTGMVAKTVRELLSIHNIGQRLFAKHVLGLSQGTVSELLSKPKSWDKLTEKGRESYRKMHHWSVDERNVLALKAISPKKGTQPLLPTIQRDDSETEQRIASILNDAQMAMQNKKQMEQVGNQYWPLNPSREPGVTATFEHQSTMVSNIYQQMAQFNQMHGRHPITSPTSSHPVHTLHNGLERERHRKVSEIDRHREKHDVNEASSKEMVERIYRQELIKLAQSAQNAGNIAASTLYQQELARLAHCLPVKEEPEPGELPRRHASPERLNVKSEPPDSTSDELVAQFNNGPIDLSKHSCSSTPSTPNSAGSDKSSLNNSAHHSASAFFVVHPKVNGHDAIETGSGNHHPMAPQAHVAFPPKPQEGSSNMSTVSPLQRMQNIANSLMSQSQITTPVNKPLRAVLPPITQEEFDQYTNVNTEDLVKQVKETLSQYSISQRLFGESVLGLSQGSVSDLLARPKPWHMLTQKGREPFIRMQLFLEDAEAIPKLVASQYHIAPEKLMRSNSFGREQILSDPSGVLMKVPDYKNGVPPSSDQPPRIPNFPLVFPGVPPAPILDQRHLLHPFHTQPPPPQCASFSYPSSMLEVVAMTSEIDTLELTSRVKDVLQFNNLGQKLFGETVLGLSQGSVSELLSKPKPWHMLSIKGREPFIKMHLWLSDQHNVERLKHCQNEIKASRRRRHSLDDRYDSTMSLPKRPRVFFSEEQKERLRQAYNRDPYPNQNTIEALANSLSVGVKTVINWFHNHRMRAKQQQHATSPNTPYPDFPASDNSGKLENSDENSNSSALSSLSGENKEKGHNPGNYLAGFPLGFPGSVGNTSQWMFPQFEPVPLMRRNESTRSSEDNNDENNPNPGNPDDNGIEENNNDIDDGDLSSSDSTKDHSANAKENDENEFDRENTSDENSENDSVIEDKYLNTESPTDRIDKESEFSASGQFLTFPHSGANKRKRSNPQYVSAGRHLDRTTNSLTNVPPKQMLDIDVEVDVEKENEGGNSEDSFSSNNFDSNLERLKKTMEFNEGGWNENGERSTSIKKMHKSITHSSGEDWEF